MKKVKSISAVLIMTFLLSIFLAIPVSAYEVNQNDFNFTISGKTTAQKETLKISVYNRAAKKFEMAPVDVEVIVVEPGAEIKFSPKISLGATVSAMYKSEDGGLEAVDGLAWTINGSQDLVMFLDPNQTATTKLSASYSYYQFDIWDPNGDKPNPIALRYFLKIADGQAAPQPSASPTATPSPTPTLTPSATPVPVSTDVPDTWAKPEVNEAAALKLAPSDMCNNYTGNITRSDFCKLAVNLLTVKTGKTIEQIMNEKAVSVNTGTFTDTADSTILAANALGIVGGKGNGIFDPNGSITRQEAAVMLQRTARVIGFTEPNGTGIDFADSSSFAGWSKDGIAFVSAATDKTNNNKVMGGTGNNLFSPTNTYTRQQAFITVKRLFNAMK